jgi:hypothetical protein
MAGKSRFHLVLDHGEQNGVVGNIETLEELDKVFCVGLVQVVKVDGFDLEGVCKFMFKGKHLDFAVRFRHQHIVIIICMVN